MAEATDTTGQTLSQADRVDRTSPRVLKHIEDALDLVQYAVASGAKKADGKEVPPDVIGTIQATAARLGFFSTTSEPPSVTTKEWTAFELAYYQLALALSPVTAETLQSTAVRQVVTWNPREHSTEAPLRTVRPEAEDRESSTICWAFRLPKDLQGVSGSSRLALDRLSSLLTGVATGSD